MRSRASRAAALEERHLSAATLLQRIESLVAEMRERALSLQSQMESAVAEIAQRQAENLQLAEQLVEFEAERNACEAREGLLQFESEQVRARLTEIEDMLRTTRQQLDHARVSALGKTIPNKLRQLRRVNAASSFSEAASR